jgi:hypothetical protein
MKMLSYIQNRAVVYGCLEELQIDPKTARAFTPGLDIYVYARMPQNGITMRMRAGVILGQKMALQADSVLETIDESLSTVTGS